VGNFFKKTKEFFDWLQHGRLVLDTLTGLGAATVLRGALLSFTHLNPVWITPLWLFAAAGATFAMTKLFARKPGQTQGVQKAATNALMASPDIFNATEYFKRAYISQLQQDIENNVRAAATQNQPNDREGFYVKLIATGLPSFVYEVAWSYIYKSQILLLQELNRRQLPLSEAKTYYDKAVSDNPTSYTNYSFDQWLAYMKSHVLLIQHSNVMVEITVRGRDFLKYLVHCGRSADDRKL
jgi:hypothetical protein